MLKKSITFTNLDGETVTEEFHFNLTKAELIELEMGPDGGLRNQLMKLGELKDRAKIMAFIRQIISISVGRREGNAFLKNEQITGEFMGTDAYSELFVEMLQNPGAQARFIVGIMPADLVAQVDVDAITKQAFADHGLEYSGKEIERVTSVLDTPPAPAAPKGLLDHSHEELIDMPIAQFHALLGTHKGKLPKPLIVLAMQRANES